MDGVVEILEVVVFLDGSRFLVVVVLRLGLFHIGQRGFVSVGVVVLVVYFVPEMLGYGFGYLDGALGSGVQRYGIRGLIVVQSALLRRSVCT